MNRDGQVRQVTAQLDSLLDRLRLNVAELNAILAPGGDAPAGNTLAPPPEEVSHDQPA